MIWICIPVFNRINLTLNCLESIAHQSFKHCRVVIFDDGSTDGTSDILKRSYPDIHLLQGNGNFWWTKSMNRCIQFVLGNHKEDDFVLTLNNDLVVPEDFIGTLFDASLRYPDSLITSVVYDIDNPQRLFDPGYRKSWITTKLKPISIQRDHLPGDESVAEITHASGRGTLIPVTIFKSIGLYEEKKLPQYTADYDFSHRARRNGYKIIISYRAKVYSYVDKTGITMYRESFSIRNLIHYLTKVNSPGNIKHRMIFAFRNCPKALIPTYILLDTFLVIGGYIKFMLRRYVESK